MLHQNPILYNSRNLQHAINHTFPIAKFMRKMTINNNSEKKGIQNDHQNISEEELQRVFDLQKDTSFILRTSTAEQRIKKLKKLRESLIKHHEDILDAAMKDFGRSPAETEATEIMPVILEISEHCKNLKRWLKPKKARTSFFMAGTQSEVRLEPRGRCLIISPWNYPINLTLGPLVPAVASGNTVIIKTSEISPHFSSVLVKIIRECFTEDEIAVVEGDASVATSLLQLPFDHIFFTGSPAIGKIVMTAAAKHLSSVTLELGGKSPVIIDGSADLELAAKTITWGKFINSGQTCIAPDHLYIHDIVKDDFIKYMKNTLTEWYGESTNEIKENLTRVINKKHSERLDSLLQNAKINGAKIIFGGHTDVDNHFVEPTLLTDISDDSTIMHEEIFGPLLPIISYKNLSEVINKINAAPKPLALYIWSRDDKATDEIIANTSAGGTCVNHIAAHFMNPNLPFGGVNNSGIGSYHGEWGMRAFSHERAVLKTKLFTAKMLFPPHAEKMRKPLQWVMKHL
ncbi:aldehyde dehydrogenase family protein [Spongiibacter marinus]|uniref:aldehyde dehydrogenase family protein n=1 Tax=Spongiibacter marinus TaxID=354246 RepID=UPI0035BE9630